MNSTTFAALVTAATGYFYMALKAAKDLDAFLRAVRDGMREFAVEAVAERIVMLAAMFVANGQHGVGYEDAADLAGYDAAFARGKGV